MMDEIKLQRVRRADAADLIAANIANVEFHAPWVTAPQDQAAFDVWFAGQITGPNVSLVARMANGQLVGVFNISGIIMGAFHCGFLGYHGYRETARQGRMAVALGQLVLHAFDELDLHRLEANIQPGNERSIALVRRAGFRKEGYSPAYLRINGEWRDHERWAITSNV
jgi:ribosomal-protein-alanine N-acetyltransferase